MGNVIDSAKIPSQQNSNAKSPSNPIGSAGSVTVGNNTIINNQASGQPHASGGGVYTESYSFDGSSGDVIVSNNTVAGNTSTFGGGIWAWSYGPIGDRDGQSC
jgi:hypothetical protein